MSIVSVLQTLLLSAHELKKEDFAAGKIAKAIRVLAALIVLVVLLSSICNISEIAFGETMPLRDEEIRDFINEHMLSCMLFWGIYNLFLEQLICRAVILIDQSKDDELLLIWFTIDDFLDVLMSLYFLVYGINLLIEFNNGNDVLVYRGWVYSGMLAYIVLVFLKWSYIKNSNKWYEIRRRYTQFYDTEGKRIPKDAYVVYYGKLYQVYWSGDVIDGNDHNMKKEWRILSWGFEGDSISLEAAVKDKGGKWLSFKVFDDGEVPIDNNASERAIRGFCIGKKNWEAIDTIRGAESSAIIYSITETAKANNLKPYEYFEHLLTELPKYLDQTDWSFLEDLLPWSPKLPDRIRKPVKPEPQAM